MSKRPNQAEEASEANIFSIIDRAFHAACDARDKAQEAIALIQSAKHLKQKLDLQRLQARKSGSTGKAGAL